MIRKVITFIAATIAAIALHAIAITQRLEP